MAIIWFGSRFRENLIARLVDFAIGTLLGSAFLGLLPAALGAGAPGGDHTILLTVLLGLLGFLALERLVAWRHCHGDGCPRHDGGREHLGVSFIYLALADLVPSLHDAKITGRRTAAQRHDASCARRSRAACCSRRAHAHVERGPRAGC